MLRAANSIADSKHADQPAAKSCSGLVPVPGLRGRDSLRGGRRSCATRRRVRLWCGLRRVQHFLESVHNVLLHEEPGRLDALRSSVAIGEVAWLGTEIVCGGPK